MLRLFEGSDLLPPQPKFDPAPATTRVPAAELVPNAELVPTVEPGSQEPPSAEAQPPAPRRGQTISFSSGMGSPGKTFLSINVAFELAAAGKKVVVVDLDFASPSLLTALGQDCITAGLSGVERLVNQGRFSGEDLSRFLMVLNFDGTKLSLLPGSASSALSQSIENSRCTVADVLLTQLCETFDFVVIDLPAFPIEMALVAHVVNTSDFAFAISGADPVSVERWLWFRSKLESMGVGQNPSLIINQVRDGVLGGNAKRQLADTFERLAQTDVACFVPQDATAADLALREGLPLQLIKKASPARHAVSMLVRQGILNQRSRLDWRVARLG